MAKARGRIRISREPQTDAIFTREQRAGKVLQVAEILRRATLSRFQYEAACRHGMRQALCLQGHPWAASDEEAARIVATALDAIGAVRPTWAVGQREATIPRENCSWCADPLDAEQMAMGDRFCSVICAKAAIANRDFETRAWDDELGRRAFYIIRRAHLPRKHCRHCGRDFQPTEEDGDYCGPICRRHSRGDVRDDRTCLTCGDAFHPRTDDQEWCSQDCAATARRYLKDRACPNCGTIFRPGGSGQRYCSPDCAVAHKPVMLGIRRCSECGGEFYPKHETAIYCSERCNGRAKEARKKAARHAALTPRCCPNCSKTFTPRRKDAVFCSERCQHRAAHKRAAHS